MTIVDTFMSTSGFFRLIRCGCGRQFVYPGMWDWARCPDCGARAQVVGRAADAEA